MKRTYKIKSCPICGQDYLSTGPNQKWCIGCAPEMKRRGACIADSLWKKTHPEYAVSQVAGREISLNRYRANHPGYWRGHEAKRRTLGFAPINQSFAGCEGHHLNQNDVIYIPKELHRGISHNIFTGKNMEQINAFALKWLSESSD